MSVTHRQLTQHELEVDYTDDLERFLTRYYKDAIKEFTNSNEDSFTVDWSLLYQFDQQAADVVFHEPEKLLSELEAAFGRVDVPIDADLSNVTIRVSNLPEDRTVTVGSFNPDSVTGELVSIHGQVSRRTPRDIVVHEAAYVCLRCGDPVRITQDKPDKREDPHNCPSCEREGPFEFNLNASDTTQYQVLRLQTPPEQAGTTETDTIDIRIKDNLVGTVNPGDRIKANCIVGAEWKTQDSAVLEIFGDANSIEKLETSFDEIDTSEYEEEIEEFRNLDDPFRSVIDSIAPSHMGDDRIKEALAYQLFGGVTAELPDGSLKRGTIHLLLCGDPGTDKSKLLSYVNRIAPRSVKTTGKGTTNAGLTFAAVQDDFADGGRSLEAGALVQAHKGVCCIDELDKMRSEDQDGVLECMSDQTVSRAVWGEAKNMPAETSILAAQNPSEGRFDRYTPTQQQIGLSSALVSRFDLIFTLYDEPDSDTDPELASHILDAAQSGQAVAANKEVPNTNVVPRIEPEALRAIVARAREINPVLTDEAKDYIIENWLRLREDGTSDDSPVPVTPRDLLHPTRLAEAAARIDFSETIETRHVERVTAVYMACLADIGIDPETGEFDADLVETGQSKSQRDRVRSLKVIIRNLMDESESGNASLKDVYSEAQDAGISRDRAERELGKLRDSGVVYEPRSGKVSLT